MQANVNSNRQHAYVLKIEHVKSIWELFQKRIGKVEITVECEDDIARTFDAWKSFSAFENAPSKKILQLTIKSNSEDCKKTARIEFSDFTWRIIGIDIAASESVVSSLYGDINDIIDGIKPWYTMLTKIDFLYVIGFILLVGWLFLILYLYNQTESERGDLAVKVALIVISVQVAFLSFLGATWGLNKLRKRFFPISFFAIGQGLKRYEVDERIRWAIIVGFPISFSASAVFSLFQ